MQAEMTLLTGLLEANPGGDLLELVLRWCAPPMVRNPGVLHRIAASAGWLWERVEEVRT